jgi:hypothetical protein
VVAKEISPEGFLHLGDEALSQNSHEKAVGFYEKELTSSTKMSH